MLAVLLLAGGSYGLYLLYRESPVPAGLTYGNGYIEATEIRLASEVGGRLLSHALQTGDMVREGDVVAVLDAADARDRLRAARAEETIYGELHEALGAQIDTWGHHLMTAERQLERARDLQAANAASARDVEQAEDAVREARGQLEALRSQRQSMAANLEAARAKAALIETQLARTEVRAPANGTVLQRVVEAGEVVAPGQVMAVVADLSRLKLKVFVPGAMLSRIRLGNPARLQVDGFAAYHSAEVTRIDDFAQFTPRDIHMPDERLRTVYGVTLSLANADGTLKPGMPADAWIRWDETSPWPERLLVPGG